MVNRILYKNTSSSKTKILLLSKRLNSKVSDFTLKLCGYSVKPNTTVKDIGVSLDAGLSFNSHIDNMSATAYYHVRNIGKIKYIHSFRTSR